MKSLNPEKLACDAINTPCGPNYYTNMSEFLALWLMSDAFYAN